MGGGGGKWGSNGAGQSGMAHRSNGGLADWPSVLAPRNVIRWPRRARGATYFRDIHHVHSSSFLYNYRHAPSSVHANGAPAGRHWGWGCPPKKAPWANPQPARNIRDIFVPPLTVMTVPYGLLRFLLTTAPSRSGHRWFTISRNTPCYLVGGAPSARGFRLQDHHPQIGGGEKNREGGEILYVFEDVHGLAPSRWHFVGVGKAYIYFRTK